jgi:hypothetical protein
MNILINLNPISGFQLFANLKNVKCEYCEIEKAELYPGNQIVNSCASYENQLYYGEIPDIDSFTVCVWFKGQLKTNVLIRPNGTIRFSMKIVDVFEGILGPAELNEYINLHINLILGYLQLKPFEMYANHDYSILLMNGICENDYMCNTEQWVDYCKNAFPDYTIVSPEWHSLVTKRKGAIKMYINNDKKGGVVIVNNKTFQLLGFKNIYIFFETIKNLQKK